MQGVAEVNALKKEHEALYTKMLSDRLACPDSFKQRQDLSKFRNLVRQLRAMAARAEYVDHYAWLANSVVQWQIAFASLLDEPLNLDDLPQDDFDAVLEKPLGRLIPDPPKGMRTSYPDTGLEQHVARYADYISLYRRMSSGSTDDEKSSDWHHGEALLSADILDGRIDFAQKVDKNAFKYMQAAWLSEIIEIRAYFRYLERERDREQVNNDRDNYFAACEYYRWRLISARSKYEPEYFGPIASYIRTNFLDTASERVDRAKANELIRRKAGRYHRSKIFGSAAQDWSAAERYVTTFYENIIPAVGWSKAADGDRPVEGEEGAKARVVEAILLSEGPQSSLSIMSAFEAAIAIYFLKDPKGLADQWYHQASTFEENIKREEATAVAMQRRYATETDGVKLAANPDQRRL